MAILRRYEDASEWVLRRRTVSVSRAGRVRTIRRLAVLVVLLGTCACDRVRTRPAADADVVAAVFRDLLSDDRKPFALTGIAVRTGSYTRPHAVEAVASFTDLNQAPQKNRAEVWLLRRDGRWRADRKLAEADDIGFSTIDVDRDGVLEVWVSGRSVRDGVVTTGGSLLALSSTSYAVLYTNRGYDRTALEEPGAAVLAFEVRFRDPGKRSTPILEETSVKRYFARRLHRGVTQYVEVSSVTRTLDYVWYRGKYLPVGFPVPTEQELQDPLPVPVPAVRRSTAVPRVPETVPAADLRGVIGAAELAFLDAYERETLAKHGFVVTTAGRTMAEVYAAGRPPYIGPDAVLYLYGLLARSAREMYERDVLSDRLTACARGAAARLREQVETVPYALRTSVWAAYAHAAAVARILDPAFEVDPDSTVALAVKHALVFVDSAPIHAAETPYRRARRLAAASPFRCQTPDGVRAAAFLALAVWSDPETLDAYRTLRRALRFLEGPSDALGPEEVLRALYRVCGPVAKPSALADPHITAALIRELGAAGTDPRRCFQLLPAGSSVIERLHTRFFAAVKSGVTGSLFAATMGSDVTESDAPAGKNIAPARTWLAEKTSPSALAAGADAEAWLCAALRELVPRYGAGTPWHLRRPAWRLVARNTQVGGWYVATGERGSEPGIVRSGGTAPPRPSTGTFPGYVEAMPRFYATMGALTAYTQRMLAAHPGVPERLLDRFRDLEQLCAALQRIAEKALENIPLDDGDATVLAGFGRLVDRFEAELGGSSASGPDTPAAALTVVRRSSTVIRYGATGRPLRIIVLVPWRGRLHWASGALLSAYEFEVPGAAPLTPEGWRTGAGGGYIVEGHPPLLWRTGVGLGGRPQAPVKTAPRSTPSKKSGSSKKTPATR